MEQDFPLMGLGETDNRLQQILALGEAPAYLKRAARVREAWNQLLNRCRRQRAELLEMVRLALGRLCALAGDWQSLRPWLSGEQIECLRELHRELDPRLSAPIEKTNSQRALRRAIAELRWSVARFNSRWMEFLQTVDFAVVNELREKYNRYYVLEKECVVRSPILARRGFERLPPATIEDVKKELPPLTEIVVWKT